VIAEAFSELLRTMWSAQDSIVTPSRFKQILGEHAPQFKGSDQQDSQEFLAFLMDAIHEDVNLASHNLNPSNGVEDDEDPHRNWMVYTERNWSIIVDMFQGQLRSVVQCLTCGKVEAGWV
jgi:ubiquitin carboxyl-terminal hydrolase 8